MADFNIPPIPYTIGFTQFIFQTKCATNIKKKTRIYLIDRREKIVMDLISR